MKKIFLLMIVVMLGTTSLLNAAYFKNLPRVITQPNGEKIECFASGDEFFNYLHDANGYTIIQAPDGYYYYAINDESGKIIPSAFKVNSVKPKSVNIPVGVKIPFKDYKAKVDARNLATKSSKAPHEGTLNNLVVYIKFADDTEFEKERQYFYDKFNPAEGSTVRNFFNEASYGMLDIKSTHFPSCELTTNISYSDSHNRGYFQPYNATTNQEGYHSQEESTAREHQLLEDAITSVKAEIEANMAVEDIDYDNDGKVDNMTFIVRGTEGEWASLLWAHRWMLYSKYVYIHGKRVYDYTFQPVSQNTVHTLCHETFHALGAPDLYHYYTDQHLSPVGPWDLMEHGFVHMTAWMKWQYTNHTWIPEIPEITESGTYTLNPLTSPTNNCYKITFDEKPSEYFMLEYRKKEGLYDKNVPGSGLIIYRINTSGNLVNTGNANGKPDLLYVYRPYGTANSNGIVNRAFFSKESGRTEFGEGTDPYPFFSDGSKPVINITDISEAGETISFTVSFTKAATVYDIQKTGNSNGASQMVGETVSTSGIVTAISTGYYYIQDGSGKWNGIKVLDNVNTPAIGDFITIKGIVKELNNLTVIENIEAYNLTSSDNDLPAVTEVLSVTKVVEAWESILVSVEGYCTGVDAVTGNWTLSDSENSIGVDSDIYQFNATEGEKYFITGIVGYADGKFTIIPRSASDITTVTGVNNIENIAFRVYPNPAEGNVTIDAGSETVNSIELYSIHGQMIKSVNPSETTGKTTISIHDLETGYYFVKVSGVNTESIQQLIVK